MTLRTTFKAGFTLVEIMIVVAIIGLLAAIALPNFVHARLSAQSNTCINNLRQIDSAKQQWALEFRQAASATPVEDDLTPYFRGNVMPQEPASGKYNILALTTSPTCSIGGTHVLP